MRTKLRHGRPYLLLVLVFLLPSGTERLFASDLSLTVRTSTGILLGTAHELVNSLNYYGQAYQLSRLDWPFKPAFFAGTSLEMETRLGLTAALFVRAAIPGYSGVQSDSDWRNYEKYPDPGLTHLSASDAFTEGAFFLDSRVGWRFPLSATLWLEPYVAFEYMRLKWTARDGYLQYPTTSSPFDDWTPDRPKDKSTGTIIVYEQTHFIPAAGLSAGLRLGSGLDARLSFSFSPCTFCNDLDNHLFAGAQIQDFNEYMLFGLLLEPEVDLQFLLSPSIRLSFSASYRVIEGLWGDAYRKQVGPGLDGVVKLYPDAGAASYEVLTASFSLVVRL